MVGDDGLHAGAVKGLDFDALLDGGVASRATVFCGEGWIAVLYGVVISVRID